MKNTAVKITVTTIGIFFCMTAYAQQAVTAKPPQVSGPVLQTTTENKTVVAPASESKPPETAVKQSSFNGPVPVKGNDPAEPAKATQQKPLPETNKLLPPNSIKNK